MTESIADMWFLLMYTNVIRKFEIYNYVIFVTLLAYLYLMLLQLLRLLESNKKL